MGYGGLVWEEQLAQSRAIRRAHRKVAYRSVTRGLETIAIALLLAGGVLVGGLLAFAGAVLTTP